MIAEAVPKTGELATKSDINELQAATRLDIQRLETRMSDFEAKLERRFNRWSGLFIVPLWGTFIAVLVRFVVGG